MSFLDLEEALGALGYGDAVDRRELYAGGFRFYGRRKESTPESRAYKREAWGRYAAKKKASEPPRRYRRHPPGTPRHLKCDHEKRKARARKYARERRAREREPKRAASARAREEKLMTATERYRAFLGRVRGARLVKQAGIVCVGRAVYDDEYHPDLRQLYEGRDPHHFAARLDFFVWLRHPNRAWTTDAIGEFFDIPGSYVRSELRTRTKYAGEDLDDR